MVDTREFPPISDYGMIGDGRTGALVSRWGAVEWCCLPFFDSSPYFAALLDRQNGGEFSLAPTGRFTSAQAYVRETNVLETRFRGVDGEACLYDAFTVASEGKKTDRAWPDHELLRVVEGKKGCVRMRMRFRPRVEMGRCGLAVKHHGSSGFASQSGSRLLMLRSSLSDSLFQFTGLDRESVVADFHVHAGERIYFSVVYASEAPAVIPPLGEAADERLEETICYWRNWLSQTNYDGPYRQSVLRSALTLKQLIFAPSGAVVAALTSSLPERIGGDRNWDYRFTWLRDASFTMRALVALGFLDEARAFASWLIHSTRLTRPRLHAVYSVFGRERLPERTLGWVGGYRGSKPVRSGNGAYRQFQLDVYGEVASAVYEVVPYLGRLDRETQAVLIGIGNVVCECWEKPDEGIWEVRNGPFHNTHSKVMAWVALDRILKMRERINRKGDFDRFEIIRRRIRESIENHGFNRQMGAYTQIYGGRFMDAAALTFPLEGYIDANNPRMRGTVQWILDELGEGGLIRRYRAHDGVGGDEGAFGICSFWMAEVMAQQGRTVEARKWFERLVAYGNPLGLWPEEVDPRDGTYLGNYPQALTHIGLINAAHRIELEERRAKWISRQAS